MINKTVCLAMVLGLLFPIFVTADAMDANREAVKKYFISNAEPKVKDAVWTSANMFKIGMLNDGTSKNGFAMYTCNMLYEYGFQGKKIWVQVVDIAKLNMTGEWVKLGEARCE